MSETCISCGDVLMCQTCDSNYAPSEAAGLKPAPGPTIERADLMAFDGLLQMIRTCPRCEACKGVIADHKEHFKRIRAVVEASGGGIAPEDSNVKLKEEN